MNLDELDPTFFQLGGWGRTLGYWVFAIRDPLNENFRSSARLQLKLAAQYDAEGQASVGDDDIWGHPEFAKTALVCKAPVQLAEDWSPMPTAKRLIGVPDFVDTAPASQFPSALAIWNMPKLRLAPSLDAFGMRLQWLLKIHSATGMPIGLAACRGFAFDEEDRFLSEVAQEALRTGGFEVFDRSPQ